MRALKSHSTTKAPADLPENAERFDRILGETVEALEESGVVYVFIGGIASGGLGRPRITQDIDIFIRPEDAETVLRCLARKGFRTEKTDPAWLYKGFKEGVLVDVIFKSKGEIYFDQEMYQRVTVAEFHGKRLRLVSPEDLLIIKALAHSEPTPGHWHDALALLSHASLDWEYLVRRARRAPRRVLSLLIYATSNDIGVPRQAIDQLYQQAFGDAPIVRPFPPPPPPGPPLRPVAGSADEYGVAHLRERLAEDSRTHELDVRIEHSLGRVLLRGEVPNGERRDAVLRIARETFPEHLIENQVRVVPVVEPTELEEIK